jgi:hypothetical protein
MKNVVVIADSRAGMHQRKEVKIKKKFHEQTE